MYALLGTMFALGGIALLAFGVRGAVMARPIGPADYLQSLDGSGDERDEFQQLLEEPFLQRVLRPLGTGLIGSASGVLPRNVRETTHQQLVYAGLSGRYRAEEVITAQILGGIGGLVLGLLIGVSGLLATNMAILAVVGLPILGTQVPRSILRRKADERQTEIRRDLPDTLDLLAISVEAGVGFEGALAIVADNFDSALAEEFTRTIHEMELGLPRRQALENLNRRTDLPELSNFIVTMVQADALGMPIGRVLKTQAEEMRLKRRAWAREKAAKLPVKILVPLLPVMLANFIVIIGPAVPGFQNAF